MGGKRPDQHNIDPAEAGATDYKDRRQDEGIKSLEKQEYTTNRADIEEGYIPKAGENPALRELRERREAAAEQEAERDERESNERDAD